MPYEFLQNDAIILLILGALFLFFFSHIFHKSIW